MKETGDALNQLAINTIIFSLFFVHISVCGTFKSPRSYNKLQPRTNVSYIRTNVFFCIRNNLTIYNIDNTRNVTNADWGIREGQLSFPTCALYDEGMKHMNCVSKWMNETSEKRRKAFYSDSSAFASMHCTFNTIMCIVNVYK